MRVLIASRNRMHSWHSWHSEHLRHRLPCCILDLRPVASSPGPPGAAAVPRHLKNEKRNRLHEAEGILIPDMSPAARLEATTLTPTTR